MPKQYKEFTVFSLAKKADLPVRLYDTMVMEVKVNDEWRTLNPKTARGLCTKILEKAIEDWDDIPEIDMPSV